MTSFESERPGCRARILGLFGLGEKRQVTSEFNYRLTDSVLTKAEISFYHVLRQATPLNTVVMAKVRLADIFNVPRSAPSSQGQRNKISSKHVDFLLCDAHTLRPLVGIELDDSSHQRDDRMERDVLVEKIFRNAGLTLLRFPAKQGYVAQQVAEQLQRAVATATVPQVRR